MMDKLYDEIEAAVEETVGDQDVAADEIYYDIAVSVCQMWDDRAEAEEFIRSNGWSVTL